MKQANQFLAIGLVFLAGPVAAHHGDEFFVLEDYEIPSILGGHLSAAFDWEKYNSADEFGAETMLMLTLAPQMAFSVSGSAADHGDGWRFSAVTPRFHVQLTPPKWELPLRVSLSFGYQFVDGAAGGSSSGGPSVVTYEKIYEQVPYTYTVSTANGAARLTRPRPRVVTKTIEVPVTTTVTVTSGSSGSSGGTSGGTSGSTTGGTTGGTGGGSNYDPSLDVDYIPPAPPHSGHDHTDTGTTTTTTVTTTQTQQVVVQSASSGAGGSGTGRRRQPATTTTTYTGTTTKVKTVKHVTQQVSEPQSEYGIHNHDQNLWTGRLIVEGDFGRTKVLFNLIGLAPEGEKPAWGYAAGIRRQITHSFGLGLESIGDFADEGMHEMILGGYVNPSHALTVKLGVGFGLTEASSDFSVRTGFTWRF